MADEERSGGSGDPAPFGNAMTMEEIEESLKEGDKPATDPDKVVLEGDTIPEGYRGKNLNDILKDNQRLQDSLRLRDAEVSTYRAGDDARRTAAPAAAAVEEVKEPTREELDKLFEDDPRQYAEVIADMRVRKAENQWAGRIASLEQGTIGASEGWAKEQFKDEFELFEKDINEFRRSVTNQAIFSTRKGWEDMISYVRGKPENIDKLFDHKAGRKTRTRDDARRDEDNNAGFNRSSSRRTAVEATGDGADSLSKEQRDVADGLGMNYKDYAKWSKVGR